MEKLAREVDVAEQPAEAVFVLALGLSQRGADAAALGLFRRAQQVLPGDFWINHDLGIALIECQPPLPEEATRFLTAAVALRPDSPAARLNLGVALARAGRLDEALVAYRHAITLKSDYSVAHYNVGLALGEQGHLDEAVSAFRRAIQLKPDYAQSHLYLFYLGRYLTQTGRFDEAVAAYRKAIGIYPDDAESHCNLGLVLKHQGKLAQALKSLERGHEMGSRRKDWAYPSAQWVQDCRRQLEGGKTFRPAGPDRIQ
jgi:Tfp pilus assembly protein PilF